MTRTFGVGRRIAPSSPSTTTRSVYLSRLRRAFLLRVHPDQFRYQLDESIVQQQSNLVKALSSRMSQYDFITWQQQSTSFNGTTILHSTKESGIYPFVIEKRDGTYCSHKLNLSDPVDTIVQEMAYALKLSGANTPQLPPSLHPSNKSSERQAEQRNDNKNPNRNTIHYAPDTQQQQKSKIDRRYDIVSNHGRNLKAFLLDNIFYDSNINDNTGTATSTNTRNNPLTLAEQIQERRSSRMDAQALALSVRKIFHFQSVDAIQTGWSSSSVSSLFRRLLELHNDHAQTFQVQSFYPIRLVFASTDFDSNNNDPISQLYITQESETNDRNNNQQSSKIDSTMMHEQIDLYDGVIRLHPGWTSVQWLKVLQSITQENLNTIRYHRKTNEERSQLIVSVLGVKIRKGHSCSSTEYHHFLQRISNSIVGQSDSAIRDQAGDDNDSNNYIANYSTAIQTKTSNVIATIESKHAIRRPSVSRDGHIRLHASMDIGACCSAIERLLPQAQEYSIAYQTSKQQCNDTIHQIQYNLGLQKIYRASPFVTHEQYYTSLQRLVSTFIHNNNEQENTTSTEPNMNNNDVDEIGRTKRLLLEQEYIKRQLTGNSLGISAEGQFCHLADDGSVVIPHNWMYTSM